MITRDFTDGERAEIPRQLADVFPNRTFTLTPDPQPIHTGEFALVYGGCLDDEHVAVKVNPRRRFVSESSGLSRSRKKPHKLRDTSFVHVQQIAEGPEIQAVVMEYVKWPTLHKLFTEHQVRLSPLDIARLLSNVALAQGDAHKRGMPLVRCHR